MEVNQKAFMFSLQNQDGKLVHLKDYLGQKILLYFYPKDNTPGCTTQACSLRDNITDLTRLNLKIFGISKDSVESHKKFTDKFNLNFDILSDENKKVIEKYGAKKGIFTSRIAFLLDEDGVIIYKFNKVDTKSFAQDVIDILNNL